MNENIRCCTLLRTGKGYLAGATNQATLSALPGTSSLVTGGADIIGTRRAMAKEFHL